MTFLRSAVVYYVVFARCVIPVCFTWSYGSQAINALYHTPPTPPIHHIKCLSYSASQTNGIIKVSGVGGLDQPAHALTAGHIHLIAAHTTRMPPPSHTETFLRK